MKVEIIGKVNCPNCERAKQLLSLVGIEFSYSDIEDDEEAFNKAISLKARELPLIFIDGEWIGGLKDLQREIENI